MNSYYVAPRPHGERFMLYIDEYGEFFLENNSRHVFQLERERALRLLSLNGSACTDTVLDGVLTRARSNTTKEGDASVKRNQKLTFVIIDATRYNGRDLTKMAIVDRLSLIKVSKNKVLIIPQN